MAKQDIIEVCVQLTQLDDVATDGKPTGRRCVWLITSRLLKFHFGGNVGLTLTGVLYTPSIDCPQCCVLDIVIHTDIRAFQRLVYNDNDIDN